MLREMPNFSAVLAANNQMALGVLSAFHQHQISIPGEKSVVGYDDTYESAFFYPALTTVSLDLDLQGKEVVRYIFNGSGPRRFCRQTWWCGTRLGRKTRADKICSPSPNSCRRWQDSCRANGIVPLGTRQPLVIRGFRRGSLGLVFAVKTQKLSNQQGNYHV